MELSKKSNGDWKTTIEARANGKLYTAVAETSTRYRVKDEYESRDKVILTHSLELVGIEGHLNLHEQMLNSRNFGVNLSSERGRDVGGEFSEYPVLYHQHKTSDYQQILPRLAEDQLEKLTRQVNNVVKGYWRKNE